MLLPTMPAPITTARGGGREGAGLRLVRQEITSYHTLWVGKRRLALRR